MKIENQYANELLISFRKGNSIQEFMDAVSGVEKYKISNINRQGCIRGMFAKELIKDQFLLEVDDIISMFWHGVFEKVDKAKLWREKVEIKRPNGESEFRETNNNPIHYLRYHGAMAVRNHITHLYRKNLHQSCLTCGYSCSIKNNKKCPKCKDIMQTTYKFAEINNDVDNLREEHVIEIEIRNMERYIETTMDQFAMQILREGRAFQIFKILTESTASIDMCATCQRCPAKTFNIDDCTNYNANIGAYLGVNKTMIANKMRGIRKRLPEFLFSEGTSEANYILDLIPKKYRALVSVVD